MKDTIYTKSEKLCGSICGILAVATIAIGLIGFVFEEQLQHIYGDTLLIPLVSVKGAEVKRSRSREGGEFLGLNGCNSISWSIQQ